MTKRLFTASERFDNRGKTGYSVMLDGFTESKDEAFRRAIDKLQGQVPDRGFDLDALAERFCATPLPATVCSDPCATMHDYPHSRSGTNLLTVAEARQMLAAILTPTLSTGDEM